MRASYALRDLNRAVLLLVSFRLLKFHLASELRKKWAGGSLQPAAGVKGISGEIKGDFGQGFEPRSPSFEAESKPGSAGCRSQRAQLSPLLCAAGNSPLASAREQCAASCLPCGRRETRRTRVPRTGTRGRALGDRGGGGSTDRQAARRNGPLPRSRTLLLLRAAPVK